MRRNQRPGATVEDAFDIRMGKGSIRIVLSASSLIADPRPRYRLHGNLGTFTREDLDPQEDRLRAGLAPTAAEFRVESAERWGRTLVCERRYIIGLIETAAIAYLLYCWNDLVC